MEKEEIIERLNKCFKNSNIDVDEYLPLLSEFLVLEHPDKADLIIKLVTSNITLLNYTIGKVREYFVRRHNLYILNLVVNNSIVPIVYYD